MPLLRAVDVRAHTSWWGATRCTTVSMPLLRAVDVRDVGGGGSGGDTVTCLNALVAGGRCAGLARIKGTAVVMTLSQCPCCGRSMCGEPDLHRGLPDRGPVVSMPLLRAVDVRAGYYVPPENGQTHCLNALVAGGRCAGPETPSFGKWRGMLSQCPCCGRSMCGTSSRPTSGTSKTLSQCPCCGRSMCGLQPGLRKRPRLLRVSMPLLRAVDVRVFQSATTSS